MKERAGLIPPFPRRRKNRIVPAPAFAHNPAMLDRVLSAAVNGIEAFPVEVEVHCGWGETLIVIVGLPDPAAKELRDRVVTALTNSGLKFHTGRRAIQPAPADVKKKLAKCVLLAQLAAIRHI